VLLATGSGLGGPVQLDVRVDSEGPGEPAGPLVFDGEFLTTCSGAVIGNSLGEQLHPIPLPIGWHPVGRHLRRPAGAPRRYTVVVDGDGAGHPRVALPGATTF
jgi:hypothetical protein